MPARQRRNLIRILGGIAILAAIVLWGTTPTIRAGHALANQAAAGRFPCGTVRDTDETGAALPAEHLDHTRAVHDAACRRDYARLEQLMANPFKGESGDSEPATEV